MRRVLKRVLIWFLILFSLSAGIREIYAAIPDKIYLHSDTERISDKLDYGSIITLSDTIKVSGDGTYTLECSLFNLIPLKEIQVHEAENVQVAVSGKNIGIYMDYDGLLVIDTQSIKTSAGENVTPADNKLKKGDYIKEIDGHTIESKEELVEYIAKSNGKTVHLDFIRNGKKSNADIQPVCAQDGTYKLGIWVRDDSQGIGTLTYIDGNGSFGALGHGVTDMDSGELLKIKKGGLYTSKIISIKKGLEGAPGELSGAIIYNDTQKLGTIQSNMEQGIFGTMDEKCIEAYTSMWYDVGYKEDIYAGDAKIRCSIGETVECYDIEIEEITLNSEEINKNFTFRVTDETLLKETGGIVQGLSGSPIIQDGKLVGAVTHVLVNDPTRGYGIFIENMLDADE